MGDSQVRKLDAEPPPNQSCDFMDQDDSKRLEEKYRDVQTQAMAMRNFVARESRFNPWAMATGAPTHPTILEKPTMTGVMVKTSSQCRGCQ